MYPNRLLRKTQTLRLDYGVGKFMRNTLTFILMTNFVRRTDIVRNFIKKSGTVKARVHLRRIVLRAASIRFQGWCALAACCITAWATPKAISLIIRARAAVTQRKKSVALSAGSAWHCYHCWFRVCGVIRRWKLVTWWAFSVACAGESISHRYDNQSKSIIIRMLSRCERTTNRSSKLAFTFNSHCRIFTIIETSTTRHSTTTSTCSRQQLRPSQDLITATFSRETHSTGWWYRNNCVILKKKIFKT